MDARQVCILIIASIIFIPFLCGLLEELIKEHVEKNKAIRKQNINLRKAYMEMAKIEEYRIYKLNFAKAMRNL